MVHYLPCRSINLVLLLCELEGDPCEILLVCINMMHVVSMVTAHPSEVEIFHLARKEIAFITCYINVYNKLQRGT